MNVSGTNINPIDIYCFFIVILSICGIYFFKIIIGDSGKVRYIGKNKN